MRIVFMGTPDFAVPSLQALLDAGHEVAAVYTQPDKPVGRKQVLTPPAVKQLALAHGLPVFQPTSLRDADEIARLRACAPELIVVVAYGKILPKAVLGIPPHGCINVHGSLLPRWRGAAPIQWAILAGDQTAGVTTMRMAEGLDTGDMLLKTETPIGARETAGELFDRLAAAGATLLTETIETLDTITPTPQDDSQSCYAAMLDKAQATIDWTRPAHEIDCLVRGLNPWPIAQTAHAGTRIKVYAATPTEGAGAPGQVLESSEKGGLVVACGAGALRLDEIQRVGGKRLPTGDFLRGYPIAVGSFFGE